MSVVWGMAVLAALALLFPLLRRRFDGAVALSTVALLALGTFALDMVLRPEAPGGAALAFVLGAAAVALREGPGPFTTARAGMLCAVAGLAGLLHWPNVALVLLTLPRRGERPAFVLTALAAAALAVATATSLGATAFAVGPWHPLLALFGSRQGLLHLTPALWLGAAGLALQLRRDARGTAPVAAAVVALVALHAACPSGPALACPREHLAPVLALLALPLGEALRALRETVRRAPGAPLWAAGALLVCWNLLFMQQYASDVIPRDFPLSFAEVARNSAALVARRFGAPLSWPANWLFAARHGTGPERFDAAAGKRLAEPADGSITLDVGQLDTDGALLLEGWSVRHPCGGSVCRAIESRARVLLPVRTDAGTLRVHASGQGWLNVSPGHAELDAPAPLGAEPADLCFVPEPSPRGLRAFTLSVSPSAGAPAPRALVDRITLSPRPCP